MPPRSRNRLTSDRGGFRGAGHYLKAAEICGVGPKEILFVAKHSFDCIGAKAAGIHTASINRRRRPFERNPYQPGLSFRTMSELADAMV